MPDIKSITIKNELGELVYKLKFIQNGEWEEVRIDYIKNYSIDIRDAKNRKVLL